MPDQLKYKTIADYSYDWETWEDQNGKFRYISPLCKRISGYDAKEFLNNPGLFESIILEEDLHIWKNHRHEICNRGEMFKEQFRIRHKEDYIVWIEHVCKAVIDENGLKLTNDAFGHVCGDMLLKSVADVMKKELREDDILARIGGDEFVLLLPKTDRVRPKYFKRQ